MGDFKKYLRPGESVTRVAGVSGKSLFAQGLYLILVVAFYWVFTEYLQTIGSGSPLSASLEPLTRPLYALMTALLALAALYVLLVILLRAAFTRYGLTDSRVLRRSFLRTRGADLSHVQDVEVIQGLLGRLLGFGDVLVHTASAEGAMTLRRVDRPHEWFREIHEAVRQTQVTDRSS